MTGKELDPRDKKQDDSQEREVERQRRREAFWQPQDPEKFILTPEIEQDIEKLNRDMEQIMERIRARKPIFTHPDGTKEESVFVRLGGGMANAKPVCRTIRTGIEFTL